MPDRSPVHAFRWRLAGVTLLLLAACLGLAVQRALRHINSRIDRRMIHSASFAARPRLQGPVRPRRSSLLLAAATPPPRRLPAFDALSPDLVQAVISIEDRRFFTHHGVNFLRTAACAVKDTLEQQASCGGSTITQQLARSLFLTQGKTVQRKVEEILIARRLEERLTKQQIFVMYLRAVSFGQNNGQEITGFDQASRVFFHRPLAQLSLADDALLAGMVHAPNFDNPFRHPERALHRRNVVLASMIATGAITEAEADAARNEPLTPDASHLQSDDPNDPD